MRAEPSKSPWRSGPQAYIGGRAINVLLAPLAVIVLPRILGAEGYGRYGYWFGLISVYLVVLDLGAQPLLRRYLPELAVHRPGQARALFWAAQKMKLLPALLLAGSLFFAAHPRESAALLAAAVAAAVATNLADVYYGYQHLGAHSVAVVLRRVLRLVLVPALAYLWGAEGILVALVVTEWVALGIASPAFALLGGQTEPLSRSWWSYYRHGAVLFLAFLAATLLGRLPVLLAGWIDLPAEVVGQVALAADLTYFALKELVNAISESLLPRIIVHRVTGRQEHLQRDVALNYRLINVAVLGCVALGVSLGGSFLGLLGESFLGAGTGLGFLIPAVILSCWNQVQNQVLLAFNKTHRILVGNVAGVVVMLSSFVLLLLVQDGQRPGVHELCGALAVGMAATNVVSYLAARPLVATHGVGRHFLRLLPGALIAVVVLMAWAPLGWLSTAAAGTTGAAIYGAGVVLARGLSRADLEELRRGAATETDP